MVELSLRGIKKRFKTVDVLHGIDLEIKDKELVVFVGPSGCGKSTLLRLIAGLDPITEGEFWLAGRNMNDVPSSKRGIAMVFQSYALYPHMDVFENMAFGARLMGLDKAEVDRRINEAARMLRTRVAGGQKTGILFGRERIGLENDEVALADEIVTFPVNPAFASLNIAQAVLLMSYEWMKTGFDDPDATRFTGPEIVPAPKEQLLGLFAHLEAALGTRGYFRPKPKIPKMIDNLRAVLTRPGFSEAELKVLRGVIASLDYFSPKEPRGSGYPDRKRKADREAGSARADDGHDDPPPTGKGIDNG